MVAERGRPANWVVLVGAAACLALTAGCLRKTTPAPQAGGAGGNTQTGTSESGSAAASSAIAIMGSSTVYPISQAVAEQFQKENPAVKVSVGMGGTGGGFKKFWQNEIDICDASRPITAEEAEHCRTANIEYVELAIAIDGLSVVVNKDNDWLDCISVAQLKKIWEPGSQVKNWSDVDPQWPNEPFQLFGADTESGTYDYFTEAVNGKSKACRSDYTGNSNDNVLVQGVASEKYALGFFGFAYYVENQQRLKALKIKARDDAECVAPTPETIENGTYTPLSRPLFLYVNRAALKRPEVVSFLQYYVSDAGQQLVTERKYIRLAREQLAETRERLANALAGK